VTKTIFNGLLNSAIKSSAQGVTVVNIGSSESYVSSQNKTHNRNDIVFKSDKTMRLPMDLQILTGDYIDSNYGLMRIKNITHYNYLGSHPMTELSAA